MLKLNLQQFAALRVNEEGTLTLRVQTGTSAKGAITTSNRTVNYLDPSADDAKVLDFATAYGGLQSHVVDSVVRTDKCELISDE